MEVDGDDDVGGAGSKKEAAVNETEIFVKQVYNGNEDNRPGALMADDEEGEPGEGGHA